MFKTLAIVATIWSSVVNPYPIKNFVVHPVKKQVTVVRPKKPVVVKKSVVKKPAVLGAVTPIKTTTDVTTLTPQEQQDQIDRNTIDNIKQDGQISQINNKVDELDKRVTVIEVPAPTPVPIVPVVSAPIDTRPPVLGWLTYTICSASNDCRGAGGSFNGGVPMSDIQQLQGRQGFFEVISNEPASIKITFVPLTDADGTSLYPDMNRDRIVILLKQGASGLVYQNSDLIKVRSLANESIGLIKGIEYAFKIELTDSSGNTSVQDFSGMSTIWR